MDLSVTKTDGVLVDYVGDELMAMWGAPAEQPAAVMVEGTWWREQRTRARLDRLERKGLTPELRHAYALAHRPSDHFARDLVDLVEGRKPAFPPPR